MKRTILSIILMIVILLLGICAAVIAEEPTAYLKIGSLELLVPIKGNLDLVSLYDWDHGEGLLGAESRVAQRGNYNASFGVVTSFLGAGMPFVGLGYEFSKTSPQIANLGLFGGYDFRSKEKRIGIKANMAFSNILKFLGLKKEE